MVAGDSLDVTRYYDLFAAKAAAAAPNAPASTSPAAAPAPAPAGPEQEPPAVHLPVKQFTAEAAIGRFYLREIAITNLQSTIRVEGSHVVIKPFALVLNGAPVNAAVDLNLGVRGYQYDVGFDAQKIPLPPLVDTFQPERAGEISGTLTAGAQVKGAGVTGASLKQNLNAGFDVLSTNLNFSIANVRSKVINAVINVIVGIPDLIQSPANVVGQVFGGSKGGKPSGWASELTAEPIDVIAARGSVSNGVVNLQNADVQSAAFQVQARGTITLESVLTNSTMLIPVDVELSHSLADRVGLVPPGTPTNAPYAALPQFLKMRGTLGNPQPDINKVALVELAAKTGLGLANRIGDTTTGDANKVLNVVGGLLNSKPHSPNTNANTQTNQPPTESPVGGLLHKLFK
jgi:hypothetical protein